MAGDSPTPRQEDIEELLRQAQMAAGLAPETSPPVAAPPPSAPADSPAAAVQAARTPPAAAVATATPPSENHATRSAADSGVGDDIQFLLAQAEQAIASVDQPLDALEKLQPFE